MAKLSPCSIFGTGGADTLTGTDGRDVICGLGGNDTLVGGLGDDVIVGGAGVDTVSYASNPRAVVVRMAFDSFPQTASGAGEDRLASVENVVGTRFDDEIEGTDGVPNRLVGGAGDDTIRDFNLSQVEVSARNILTGGPGEDVLESHGDSLMNGGPGDDTLHSRADADALAGGTGDDDLDGRTFARSGELGVQRFNAGPGDDTVIPGAGNDEVLGGLGIDLLSFECQFERPGCAVVVDLANHRSSGRDPGAAANTDRIGGFESVLGSPVGDVIRGDRHPNRLLGGRGGDAILGDRGDDTLLGNGGNDRLTGGPDVDRCLQGGGRGPVHSCELPRR